MSAPPVPIDLSVLLFLQITIILAGCRLVGWIAKYLGQPAVVGEMIAGVLLGPSLFGFILPEIQSSIFPATSMPALYLLSQLGLALYMFVVGIEFKIEDFQRHGKSAVGVSIVGMVAPFALGGLLAIWLHREGGFFPENIPLYLAVLFLGASICITAFPMLARIIVENNLSGTSLGTLSLAAGAIDDVAAWCVLALILACTSGDWFSLMVTVGGGMGYVFVVLVVVRPWLRMFTSIAEKNEGISNGQLTFILGIVMLGSCFTNWIGIHSVFGAFLLGCAIPRGTVGESLKRQIEPITLCLLVPLFFAYSGLKTRLDLVGTPWLLWVALVVLIVASVSKGVACWAAARWTGESTGTAMAIGCLMNARGMMGLIVLMIGKENGVIGQELFAILVLMAILTTLAATPTYRWVQARYLID